MKYLIVLALAILSAYTIWAAEITENTISEEEATTSVTAEVKKGTCTFFCALKTLLVDEDEFAKDLLKLFVEYDDESVVDAAFDTCNQRSFENDDSCESYFDCVDVEFKNNNITRILEKLLK